MKKLIIVIVIITVLVIAGYKYLNDYEVVGKVENIEEAIHERLNKKRLVNQYSRPRIKKTLDIGEKKFVLYYTDNMIGDAILTKGFLGNYRLEMLGGGTKPYQTRVVIINDKKYLIVLSRKFGLDITSIKVKTQDREYISMSIPNEEYFIISKQISSTIRPGEGILSVSYFNLNKDITDKVYDMNDSVVKEK